MQTTLHRSATLPRNDQRKSKKAPGLEASSVCTGGQWFQQTAQLDGGVKRE